MPNFCPVWHVPPLVVFLLSILAPKWATLTLTLCTEHCVPVSHLHVPHQNSTSTHFSTVYEVLSCLTQLLMARTVYTLIEQGQEATSRALEFGHENGLKFGADKTEVVVFTCKRLRVLDLPCLHMGSKNLLYSDPAKYLGILLDSKSTFGPRIRDKVKKATRFFHRFKTSVGCEAQPISYKMDSHRHCPTKNYVQSLSLGKQGLKV